MKSLNKMSKSECIRIINEKPLMFIDTLQAFSVWYLNKGGGLINYIIASLLSNLSKNKNILFK